MAVRCLTAAAFALAAAAFALASFRFGGIVPMMIFSENADLIKGLVNAPTPRADGRSKNGCGSF